MQQNEFKNLQRINTNSPRETLVYSADGLVVKRPGPHAPDDATWIGKQRHAQMVMAQLRAANNSAYAVPTILQISLNGPFVVEERMYGTPLTSSYVETLKPTDMDIIYRGFANFVNDINQSRPVYTQSDTFDAEIDQDGRPNMPFNEILKKLKKYIKPAELKIISQAKEWFDVAAQDDASMVFSHGDMNENNIFYNPDNHMLSVIDFADAKYENAHYMFNRDLARLGWLDIDRLKREYMALPRTRPVIIETNPMIEKLRNKLKNFAWSATPFLSKPTVAPQTRLKIIRDSIADVKSAFESIQRTEQFNRGRMALDGPATGKAISEIVAANQHQK